MSLQKNKKYNRSYAKGTQPVVCAPAADLQTPPVAGGWSGMWLQKRLAGASRGVSDDPIASPVRLFTSDGRIRRQPCGSNPALPLHGTQTRIPSQCCRYAGTAEKYQQRLFTEWCHSVLPGLRVYLATLPCIAPFCLGCFEVLTMTRQSKNVSWINVLNSKS